MLDRFRIRASCPLLFTALVAATALPVAAQVASTPPLLSPVANPPAAAITWDAAERARSPMVARSGFVRIDTAALAALPLGGAPPLGTFTLDLFEVPVQLDVMSLTWTLGYRVFHGRVPGQTSEVHITVAGNGAAWGSIDVGSESFVLAHTGIGDVHVLQRIDHALLPLHMRCGTDASHGIAAPVVGSPDNTNTDCGRTTIDVLVCYTPQARTNAGGAVAMEAAIVGAIAQANSAFLDSNVSMEFRLVHMAETNYAELGSSADLYRFQTDQDGFMDEVFALRTTYGADLMHLITDPASAQYCGIGFLMTSLSTGFAANSFAVTVRTCISNRSFTHECGHNMGCHHDAANAGPAIYPYAYGYRTPDNAYRTIMAYAPGTRINRLSSPNVQYLGYTMGVAGAADNALTLTNTRTTVAQFAATQAPVWCDLGGGIPGALGKPTLTGAGTINLADPLTLTVRSYAPNAIGLLVVGASAINVPLFGGVLVPSLDVPLTITGNGADIVHNANWLANLSPGFQAWFQAAFLDLAATQGFAASDAVKVTVP
jgi:hypothetical protein